MRKKIEWVPEMAEAIRQPDASGFARGEYPDLGRMTVEEAIANLTGEFYPNAQPPETFNCRCTIAKVEKLETRREQLDTIRRMLAFFFGFLGAGIILGYIFGGR